MGDSRYIYFHTLDHTGTYTTSGYTLPITPFTFIPIFDDGTSVDYSNYKILWDFGDGTKSESITAVHNFKYPAWYNVKCYVLGKNGNGYESSFSQSILVKDFISDTLVLSGYNNKTESGTLQNPFTVFRFNSWQSYPILSSYGYTINLHVSGNNAPLLDKQKYDKDKWGHLKPSARFETTVYNSISEKEERTPVNSLLTESNSAIYVKLFNNSLVFCDKNDVGSCFAGTSGKKLFYYIDDIPKKVENVFESIAATIYASFDTSKFRITEEYEESKYSILNNVSDSNSFSVLIQQLNPSHVTISSNGIDEDGDGKRIHTFDIDSQKSTNSKIPFVVRVKDINEYNVVSNSKYTPLFTLSQSPTISEGQIYLELRDSRNQKISSAQFYSNFGVLSSETLGGYFKGYLICPDTVENVHIYANAGFDKDEIYLVNTSYGIIGHPQFEKIHNLTVQIDPTDKTKKTLVDKIYDIPGLSGIYSTCVTTKRLPDASEEAFAWVVDGDREKVVKFIPSTMTVVYDDFDIPQNSSPSNICSDKFGNVWVTLYDAVSTIRINNITNLVDKVITPSLTNNVIDFENTITPASVDTDLNNNVWVSYSNELSAFVEKYDTEGNFLFCKVFSPSYQNTELITDLDNNAWCIIKDNITNSKVLSSKNDQIVKISSDGSNITYYPINGSLWNLTIDSMNNIWATRNRNEVVRIDTQFETFQNYYLPSNSSQLSSNYISDLEGIAGTTDNNILVVDNVNRRLHYFNAAVDTYGFVSNYVDFLNAGTFNQNRIQDKINGYGDWNGFRHINKFCHILGKTTKVEGNSNSFSIYDKEEGKYDIRKVNENFDPKAQLFSYRFQDYLLESNKVFDFIGESLGTLSSEPTDLGKTVYEKIANFCNNVNSIDSCNIRSLKSMHDMLGEDFQSYGAEEFSFPAKVGRLVDIFSIPFTKLKGSRDYFTQNFNDRGYYNQEIIKNGGEVIYGYNKGLELDVLTTVLTASLTAGENGIIAYEKFSESYTILNTKLLSTEYINFIDPVNKTYALSTYHPYWGWGLQLPDTYLPKDISKYYTFYEYIPTPNFIQTEGIINWADANTTISEYISSVEEWNKIREDMISYSLVKGVENVK
jgi:hypothetical protein